MIKEAKQIYKSFLSKDKKDKILNKKINNIIMEDLSVIVGKKKNLRNKNLDEKFNWNG